MTQAPPSAALTPDTTVVLHELAVRPEGEEAVVGRMDTGDFVALPLVGVRAIELLRSGLRLGEAEDRLEAELGQRPDLGEFVESLVEIGFVRAIDGTAIGSEDGREPSLPWLEPRHVRWLFGRGAKAAYSALVLASLATLALHPELFPSYHDFVWSDITSLVIVVNTAMFLLDIAAHETAHLAAARSFGVPARITLGTRLYNLVAQTDVSGLWALPRRCRYRGYLAGMLWDGGVASACLLALAWLDLPSLADGLLSALLLMIVLGLLSQLQLFMRTDLYFVVADLLDAKNLFEDATVYLGVVWRRLLARVRGAPQSSLDGPLGALSPRELRIVRIYAWLMLLGSLVALTLFALYVAPVVVVLLADASRAVAAGIRDGDPWQILDGVATWAVEGGLQVAFLVVFARSRREWLSRLRRRWSEARAPAMEAPDDQAA